MLTLRLFAFIAMVTGVLKLLDIRLLDLFKSVFDRPKSIRDQVNEVTNKKKKNFLRREVEEITEIMRMTGREDKIPVIFIACGVFLFVNVGTVHSCYEKLLEEVNQIVHPAVRNYLEERIEEARQDEETEILFIEAALLIEAGYKELMDELWYIYADEEVRRTRLKENRGYSDEKISQIMESQLSEEEFRKECDFVIDNSGKVEDSYKQIQKKLEEFTWLKEKRSRN